MSKLTEAELDALEIEVRDRAMSGSSKLAQFWLRVLEGRLAMAEAYIAVLEAASGRKKAERPG